MKRLFFFLILANLIVFFTTPKISSAQSPYETYTIQAGDWLSKLAEKYYGDPLAYSVIVDATNDKATQDHSFTVISDPGIIEIGQKLWIPSPVELITDPTQVCQEPFRESINWAGVNIIWPPTDGVVYSNDWIEMSRRIVPQVIEVGELYLNYCLESDLLTKDQIETINKTGQLNAIWPPDAFPDYENTSQILYVQTVNLDADTHNELILNGIVLGNSRRGNISVVYDFDEATQTWHGTLVWPGPSSDYGSFTYPHSLEPQIYSKVIDGQPFVFVEGGYGMIDATAKYIRIWRWGGSTLEMALEIRLSSWCDAEGWDNWEVKEDSILVHGTEATYRCEPRKTVIYTLEDGEFIASEP